MSISMYIILIIIHTLIEKSGELDFQFKITLQLIKTSKVKRISFFFLFLFLLANRK